MSDARASARQMPAAINGLVTDLRSPSEVPHRRRPWLWFALIALLGVVLNLLPRPNGWTLEHVHKEDGLVFLVDWLESGPTSLFEIYSGYVHLAPRLVTGACAELFPLTAFAACVGVGVAAVKLLGMLLAFPVFTTLLKSWRWGLTVASTVLLLPIGQAETLGNTTNLRWYMVAMLTVMMLGNFRGAALAIVASAVALVAGLTDPLAFFVAPLAIMRLLLARRWALLPPIIALGSMIVHAAFFLKPGDRGEVLGPAYYVEQPIDGALQLLIRGVLPAQYGLNATSAALLALGVWAVVTVILPAAVAAIATAAARRPPEAMTPVVIAWVLVIWGFGMLAVTLSFTAAEAISLEHWWTVKQVARYSTLAALFMTPALLIFIKETLRLRGRVARSLAILSLAIIAVALVLDFPGDRSNAAGPAWVETVDEARMTCDEGAATVRLQFTPDNVPLDWSSTVDCSLVVDP